MRETTFAVSPEVGLGKPLGTDRSRRDSGLEPARPDRGVVDAADSLILLSRVARAAASASFFLHYPLRLSPDAVWLTLARGFALHVNLHAEQLRHRFVPIRSPCSRSAAGRSCPTSSRAEARFRCAD